MIKPLAEFGKALDALEGMRGELYLSTGNVSFDFSERLKRIYDTLAPLIGFDIDLSIVTKSGGFAVAMGTISTMLVHARDGFTRLVRPVIMYAARNTPEIKGSFEDFVRNKILNLETYAQAAEVKTLVTELKQAYPNFTGRDLARVPEHADVRAYIIDVMRNMTKEVLWDDGLGSITDVDFPDAEGILGPTQALIAVWVNQPIFGNGMVHLIGGLGNGFYSDSTLSRFRIASGALNAAGIVGRDALLYQFIEGATVRIRVQSFYNTIVNDLAGNMVLPGAGSVPAHLPRIDVVRANNVVWSHNIQIHTFFGVDIIDLDGELGDEVRFRSTAVAGPLGGDFFETHVCDIISARPNTWPRMRSIVGLAGSTHAKRALRNWMVSKLRLMRRYNDYVTDLGEDDLFLELRDTARGIYGNNNLELSDLWHGRPVLFGGTYPGYGTPAQHRRVYSLFCSGLIALAGMMMYDEGFLELLSTQE